MKTKLELSFIARLSFNSSNWQRPTGEAKEQEAEGTYNQENGFGHEDWLFRSEWSISGWRYAFIQGVNKSRMRLLRLRAPFSITLFTIDDAKRRRFVTTIKDVECLTDPQAESAVLAFKERGWLDTMRQEVSRAGGKVSALGADRRAKHILNVRFRAENVMPFAPGVYAADDDPVWYLNRYNLTELKKLGRKTDEKKRGTRRGDVIEAEAKPYWRKATAPVQCTPEHAKMQARLLADLKGEYPKARIVREEGYVDVTVETEDEVLLFEIKTDQEPRSVIRQALGQLLEYAYYSRVLSQRRIRLIVAGRNPLGAEDLSYLGVLQTDLHLPIDYRVVPID